MDETYVKVNGDWKYLYRAVDVTIQPLRRDWNGVAGESAL